jgi:murein DD-endopeptidase MepM/ murein hydrolase activator NlpD
MKNLHMECILLYKKKFSGVTEPRPHFAGVLLRLSLIFCIFLYFPLSIRPLYAAMDRLCEKQDATDDNGMGGALYTESDLQDVVLEQVSFNEEIIGGVREPLEFSAPQMLLYTNYKIQSGDMIGPLASTFGLNQDTLISLNGISNTRAIQVGKFLKVPNQDGVLHTIESDETLEKIAEKYEVNVSAITTANELFSDEAKIGSSIFVPGAKLDYTKLQEINGDLFVWPVSSRRITSRYGYRISPISGARGFHSGLDISGYTGLPVKAAMAGRVISAGYSAVFGNYVVISHHSNYRTLYGHMNVLRTKVGAYVKTGERIGDVGNTGQSTGSHLHFQVYKNGITVNPIVLMN